VFVAPTAEEWTGRVDISDLHNGFSAKQLLPLPAKRAKPQLL